MLVGSFLGGYGWGGLKVLEKYCGLGDMANLSIVLKRVSYSSFMRELNSFRRLFLSYSLMALFNFCTRFSFSSEFRKLSRINCCMFSFILALVSYSHM